MKTLLKLLSLCGLIAPIIHLIVVFSAHGTIEIKATMAFIPSVLVFLLALIIVSYIYANVRAKMIQQPFGNLSMLFYAGVGAILIGAIMIWFVSILATAEHNYNEFIKTFTLYINTLKWLLLYFGISIVCATIGFVKYKA